MLRLVLAAAVAATGLIAVSAPGSQAATSNRPVTHALSVSGTGIGMYPAYHSSVRRYAATTEQASFPSNAGGDKVANSGASITVAASTTDPDGKVFVNGVRLKKPQVTVKGLSAGDEISVIYVDSRGREADSIYVLPADFPRLTATTGTGTLTPGLVGLTMFDSQDASMPRFAAAVDSNGVPVWSRASMDGLLDLKRQPNGSYSIGVPTTSTGRTGSMIEELGPRFQHLADYQTVGLTDTDNHDSILRADGSRVLLAYEPNAATNRIDSVIQEVDATGTETFRWSSGDVPSLAEESVTPNQVDSADPTKNDYAHINSVRIVNDGRDFLASFRGLSAVLLIARKAHDGYSKGDIVWKLGGRDSSFSFVDDPASPAPGPCAQHAASMLPNGDIMIFDDGSVPVLGDGPNCVNANDPQGALVARQWSRVAVYRLDTVAHTATLVRSYQPDSWFSWFMGWAQYLSSTKHVMIGWAAETRALAEEIAPSGGNGYTSVWRLAADPSPNGHTYISYRAQKFKAPDAIKPTVSMTSPAAGATYAIDSVVRSDFSCTDRGGSTLRTCDSKTSGRTLDTSKPGAHTFTVTATDGAGNVRKITRHYTVGPVIHRPDVLVQSRDGSWRGHKVYGGAKHQTATWNIGTGKTVTVSFRLVNRGNYRDRCLVTGTRGTGAIGVTYTFGGKDVTSKVVAGTWRTPVTQVGHRQVLHVTVRVATSAAGASRAVIVRCVSPGGGPGDTARLRARAR